MLNRIFFSGAMALVLVSSCNYDQVEPQIDCTLNPIELTVQNVQNTSCNAEDGQFEIVATGGTAPFSFAVDGVSDADGVFEGISAGNYNVLVTDANGCTAEVLVAIENEDGVNLTQVVVNDAGCGETEGSIEMVVANGVEPYVFSINGTEQSNNTFSNLLPGEYEVAVTDQLGCEVVENVRISSGVSFESSIKSIIELNCAISNCHNGSVSPDLRTLSGIQARANRVKARTADGSMPRGRTLSQEQIDLIACWVDDGALDN